MTARVKGVFRNETQDAAVPVQPEAGSGANPTPLTRTWRRADLLPLLLVAVAYFLAARAGFRLALLAEQVTVVWPPSGIALAAVLLLGTRVWPALWVGALLANLSAHAGFAASTAIATGNTAEALAGAWLLRRAGFDTALERLRDAAALILLAAGASTTISATVGNLALCLTGVQPWAAFGDLWRVWWLGDATGDLVVAPLILTLRIVGPLRLRPVRRWIEGAAIVAVLAVVSGLAFPLPGPGSFSFAYAVFPLLIWAAFRFGQAGTVVAAGGISAAAVWLTTVAHGQLPPLDLSASLVRLQVFLGVLCATSLLLGAALSEREATVRRREAEHRVTRALASAPSLDEAAREIVRAICASLRWDTGGVWIVDEPEGHLSPLAVWHDPEARVKTFTAASLTFRFEKGIGLPGRIWRSGQPAWIENVTVDGNFPRAFIAARAGLRGAFGFPILIDGQVVGVVDFFSRRIRPPDPDLLGMCATLGSEIGQYIQRRRLEDRLTERERNLQAVVDSALDAIIVMDEHGLVRDFNPAAESVFGWDRDEAVGRPLADLVVPPELRERHRAGLHRWLATGESRIVGRRVELEALRRDGSRFPVELTVTAGSSNGRPQFTGFIRDITARRQAEAERARLLEAEREAKSEADAANRAKDEFLAVLSHELRTPLNAILGWAHLLSQGLDPAAAEKARQTIIRNVKAQQMMIEDLLDVSRIIRGQIELRRQPVRPEGWFEPAVESARPLAAGRGIRLESRVEPGADPVFGDAHRLQQILSNLLGNAIKFTPAGGTVRALLRGGAGLVEVTVTDSGKGIPPEELSLIFEPFRQGDTSSRREHRGLGLGLAIVHRLVTMHGGSISAESPGRGLGSTFRVVLPAANPAFAAPDAASTPPLPALGETTLRGVSILVVEDDPDSREVTAAMLRETGAEVAVADSVDEALRRVARARPDVIVSDIEMAGRDGYDLARAIRGHDDPRVARVPLLALTAYAHPADRERALREGFALHLTKPVEPQRLLAGIASLLPRARAAGDGGPET